MKEAKTYHAVHDQDGNIKSIFVTASSVGAQQMMTPGKGCSISQVNLHELKIPGEFKITGEEDADRLREFRKHYRVDTSIVGSLVKKNK
jgi:hypothetical protein